MLNSDKRKRYFEEYFYEIDSEDNTRKISPFLRFLIAVLIVLILALLVFIFI